MPDQPPDPGPAPGTGPTPADFAALAASFSDLPGWAQITGEELEMVEEEVTGRPVDHGAHRAEALRRRIAFLEKQRAAIVAKNQADPSRVAVLLAGLDRDLQTQRDNLARHLASQ